MRLVKPTRPEQFDAIFQTMVAVVTVEGRQTMVPLERRSIEAIGHYIFDHEVSVDRYPPAIPAKLEETIEDPELRTFFVRMLMTLPLVSGEVSKPQIDVVDKVARRLNARGEEFALLERAVSKSWYWFIWRLMRHGVEEYWNTSGKATWRDWFDIFVDLIAPGSIRKPDTAARYQALRALPPDTLGGALVEYYIEKKFPLPGEKGGMNEKFALHDFYHIVSGYPPEPIEPGQPGTVRGEMLVSVFTGGNKAYHPMDWVIVPLLQWHCAAPVITFRKRYARKDLLDPDAYFHALRRGMEMTVNMMDKWNWWDHIHERVDDVRVKYHVPPLDPRLDGTRELPRELYEVGRPARKPELAAA